MQRSRVSPGSFCIVIQWSNCGVAPKYENEAREKMTKQIKLEDVAAKAGVSKATVSRVINRRGYLSQKTIMKVEEAMSALNYHPNVIAQQMHTQRTKQIGIIVPTVGTPFFGELAAELERRLFNKGYKVIIGGAENDPVKERKYLQQLLGRQVDGLIIATHNANIAEYQHANLPIVAIDRYLRDDIPVVYSDNYAGAREACQALLDRGATRVAYTDNLNPLNAQDEGRLRAYRAAMRAAGMPELIYPSLPDPEAKRARFAQLFAEHPEVDAVFASNDLDAALLLDLATQRGLRVPEDLQIIGYDGTKTTQTLLPGLVTVVQPLAAMAERTVALLEDKINRKPTPAKVVLPVTLKPGRTLRQLA